MPTLREFYVEKEKNDLLSKINSSRYLDESTREELRSALTEAPRRKKMRGPNESTPEAKKWWDAWRKELNKIVKPSARDSKNVAWDYIEALRTGDFTYSSKYYEMHTAQDRKLKVPASPKDAAWHYALHTLWIRSDLNPANNEPKGRDKRFDPIYSSKNVDGPSLTEAAGPKIDFGNSKNWKSELKRGLQKSKEVGIFMDGEYIGYVEASGSKYDIYDATEEDYVLDGASMNELIQFIEEWLEEFMG